MGKDKISKSESKKVRLAEKKQKQERKNGKKEKNRKARINDSDDDDEDIDAVLADYAKKQEQFLKVTETKCDPPKARSSSTLIASPQNENELFLFGGEYFDGASATFFNDLHVYHIGRDEWHIVTSPNTPLPRSGHAWSRGSNTKIYLFGGEVSNPKQGTFYHYSDLWELEPLTREWARIETKGVSPPARSGHRMTFHKNYIILFGGFQDTSQQTKYLSDLWIYDTKNFVWYIPTLPLATINPDARSSFSLLPHESGGVLYGGYARVKAIVKAKHTKGGGQAQRNVLKPLVYEDCFFLRIVAPSTEAPATPPTVRWERRKKPANAPNPARAGATMTYHKGRGIQFGGVYDVEESEDRIDSEFFNTLFAWNIERNRYFPLSLRKPRVGQRKAQGTERLGRRGRGQANENELIRNLAALQTGKPIEDVNNINVDKAEEVEKNDTLPTKEVLMEFPHPRFNAQLAVQGDQLFIYGGTFEKGDREYTLDEMYSLDLGRLDGVELIFRREVQDWLGSDVEDTGDEDEGEEDTEGEEEDSEEDSEMPDTQPPYPESKRNKLKIRHAKVVESSETASTVSSSTFGDAIDETISTSTEDNLPHPRPFETRKDFFQRTGNDWQEVLITSLRWKGIQPESLSLKEIKTRAFEYSEAKWWDCREEIMALEEALDEAGIGEVASLAVGEGIGVGRRR